MNYTFEQLHKIFLLLPETVQQSMAAVETADLIHQISVKHSLHIDQENLLAQNTGYIMLGVMEPADFSRVLSSKLGITDDKAIEIIRDINERIFAPIQEDLKKSKEIKEKVLLSETEEIEKVKEGMGLDITNGPYMGKPGEKIVQDIEIKKADNLPNNLPRDVFQEKLGKLFRAPLPGNRSETGNQPTIEKNTDPYRESPA